MTLHDSTLGMAGGTLRIDGMEWAKPRYSRSQINRCAKLILQGEPDFFADLIGFNDYWGAIRVWTHNLIQQSAPTMALAARKFRASLS